MIEVIQAPANNRVLADGNDTLIKIQTSISGDYFLRALIFVDDAQDPFLSQAWSKDENGLAVFNLKHLYYSYFKNAFPADPDDVNTGFRILPGLFKKISITLQEFQVGGTIAINELDLSDFYMIKNAKPQIFDDGNTVTFLDLPQENIKALRSGNFTFPLFLKSGASCTAEILDDQQNVIDSIELQNYPSQVLQFDLNLQNYDLSNYAHIFVKFTTSQDSVQKKLVLLDETVFPPKQIFYLNNFGIYCIAYLTGRKEDSHDLNPKSYAQHDGTSVTYDIEDTKEIQLSSGYGYKDISELIHSIATSLDIRMAFDGIWERVSSETKKVLSHRDNQYIYGDALKFSRLNVANFTNENTYTYVPELADIVKTGPENQEIIISKQDFLDAYTATQSATKIRISSLPDDGSVKYETSGGVVNLSDQAANNPEIIPLTLDLDDFIELRYTPDPAQFGEPLDTIKIQLGTAVIWSNVADLILNITEDVSVEYPPTITANIYQYAAIDLSGNGSKQIQAAVSHPYGDPFTIAWTVLNGAPITFDDDTIQSPTLTFSGAADDTDYQIKITATNTDNGLQSEKIITVRTSSYSVSVSSSVKTGSTIYSQKYDLLISGGAPGETVTFKRQISAYDFRQWVIYNDDLPEEQLFKTNISEITVILDQNGEILIPIEIYNESSSVPVWISLEILSVSGAQIIDTDNDFERVEFYAQN